MALKKKSKVTPIISKADVLKMAEDYNNISKQIKMLESKKKELSDKLKQGAESYGVQDDKGSYFCGNEDFMCGNVAKRSVSLDMDKAVKLLQKNGLNDLIEEKIVQTVDEKKLEKAVMDGTITDEEFNSIMNDRVSYSVSVRKVDDMPEVEVSALMAARKK